MKSLILLPCLCFLLALLSGNSTAEESPSAEVPAPFSDCFGISPQRALSNAAPTAEFFNVSPEDCLRHCARDRRCHTIVFHRHFSTCQLYAGATEGEEAREVSAKGHDMYSRREADCEAATKKAADQRKEEEQKKAKGQAQSQQ